MTRVQYLALAVLCGQLLLAALLLQSARSGRQGPEIVALLPGSVAGADGIHISDAGDQAVLARQAGQWILPNLHDLPVAADQLAQLTGTLQGLKTGWPVSTTRGAHERFEVSAEKYQRRVQWFDGKQELGILYVGTAPDFRLAHVRLEGHDEVYALELSSYQLPATDLAWIARDLLAVEKLQRLEGPDYRLTREGEGWQLHSLGQDAPSPGVNQQAADDLVKALEELNVLGLHQEAQEQAQDAAGEAPAEPVHLSLRAAGREWQYSFFRMGEEDYRVSRDDRPLVFTLSRADYERIAGVTHAGLLAAETPLETTTATGTVVLPQTGTSPPVAPSP